MPRLVIIVIIIIIVFVIVIFIVIVIITTNITTIICTINILNTILNHRQPNLNNLHQNLDKTILDLIAHQNSGVWCVSVVQLVALVYKVPILIINMAN